MIVAATWLLSGCAAGVWDRRVYDCDAFDRVVVREGSLEVRDGGSAPRDDCYVEVRSLGGLTRDSEVLSGTGIQVATNRADLRLQAYDSEVAFGYGPRRIEGFVTALDYEPRPERVQVDTDERVVLDGPFGRITVAGDGVVEVLGRFDVIEGDIDELRVTAPARFERIEATVDRAILQLPLQNTYWLDIDGTDDVFVDAALIQRPVAGSSRVDLTGDDIELFGIGEPPRRIPFPVDVHCDLPELYYGAGAALRLFRGPADRAIVDVAYTGEGPEGALYEWHPMRWDYGSWVRFLADVGTWEPGVSSAGSCDDVWRRWDELSYLARRYDADGELIECIASGHDPMGMLSGLYDTEGRSPSPAERAACELIEDRW